VVGAASLAVDADDATDRGVDGSAIDPVRIVAAATETEPAGVVDCLPIGVVDAVPRPPLA
jgi:hypothetical protein